MVLKSRLFFLSVFLITFLVSKAQVYTVVDTVSGFQKPIQEVRFHKDGKYIGVLEKEDDKISIYEADSNKLYTTLFFPKSGNLNYFCFSNSGNEIGATGSNGCTYIWDWRKKKLINTFFPKGKILSTPGMKINFCGFLKNDEIFVFGGDNKKITEVKFPLKLSPSVIDGPEAAERITCGTVSNDATWYGYASANLFYLKNIYTSELKVIAGSSDIITAIRFLPDGKRIGVRCKNKMVDFWNYQTKDKVRTIKDGGQPRGDDYSEIAFTKDGKFCVTGSLNAYPSVWDDDYRLLYNLPAHKDSVKTVDFSDDSRQLATGSEDKMVYIWYISDGQYKQDELKKIKRNPNSAKIRQIKKTSGNGTESTIAMSGDSVPQELNDRKIKASVAVEVKSKNITFYVWDDDQADGDIVSLNLNNEWILTEYKLTKTKKVVNVKIQPGGKNFLMLFAHNEGSISPNTCGVAIYDGYTEKRLMLKSDLKSCDAVRLILK